MSPPDGRNALWINAAVTPPFSLFLNTISPLGDSNMNVIGIALMVFVKTKTKKQTNEKDNFNSSFKSENSLFKKYPLLEFFFL